MRREIFLVPMIALLMFGSGATRADDTDVYINPGAGLPEGSEPIIMFSLDWRPNLTATACQNGECQFLIDEDYLEVKESYVFFDVLRAVLKKVFDPLEGVKVGLMLNHDHINGCAGWEVGACSGGGYIAMGATLFHADDSINGAKARFHQILKDIPLPQGSESHSYQGKELFFELFRYLTGQGVFNGHNGYSDYGTDTALNIDADIGPSWDETVETGGSSNTVDYVSPLEGAGECSRLYTVNFMFQVSNQDDDSDKAILASPDRGGFGSPQRQFDDVIRFLYDADLGNNRYGDAPDVVGKQNVISYFLVKDEAAKGQMTARYARAGGTGAPIALSDDPRELIRTLNNIFSQIISVSTTFVAASVPVNVFNRAEITDNVYIALFQVDADARPYWVGNVKKLRLEGAESTSTNALLVDYYGDPAIAGDGRINYTALTYWTLPNALPPPVDPEVSGADGRSVARGGAGQRIPGMISGSPGKVNGGGGRTIFYNDSDSSLAPLEVNDATALALQPALGAVDAAEASDLIAYMRGLDVDDADGDSNTDEPRRWIFGDPLHSRPLPLNYGALNGHTEENPAIYLAVGSNDGMIRMIRNTTTGGAESGGEVWAFMPQSSMYAQKKLRANAAGSGHPYTVDGAPVAFFLDKDSDGTIEPDQGDKVYLYFGLRRGGKAYYAMDITNPEQPDLLWSIGKGSLGYEELGNTFSTPRVGLVRVGADDVPVIMFGGGYDFNKDLRGEVGTDDSEGNAIYVVNATDGSLVWKAVGPGGDTSGNAFFHGDLVDSIPSALAVADMDGDGYTDRIVVGDTGGNVWRADLNGYDPGAWSLSLLASLGRHALDSGGKEDDRRFFHRPDLVPSRDEHGAFDAVLIGSGDRPDPLDIGGMVDNYFYMIKDRNFAVGTGIDTGIDHSYLADVTDNCLQVGGCSSAVDLGDGWKLQLEAPGEKVLATPITIAGNVYFTSYVPQGELGVDSCSPSEGGGRLWALDIQNAFSAVNYNTSDDTAENPDAPTTKADRFTTLLSPGIPAEVVSIPPNKILRPDLQIDNVNTSVRWRTFWHLEEEEL